MRFRGDHDAFGAPGLAPRWAAGDKEGVGTSYSADCRLWFTIARGIVTEVYFPLIDHPQTRDLQYLLVDAHGRFLEEKRHLPATVTPISDHALGYRVRRDDPDGGFRLEKEVIAHPHLPCLLVHTALRPTKRGASLPRLFALLAPHLDGAGYGNNGYVVELADRSLLVAERNGTWLALGADVPFTRLSAGFVGASDGWTDLAENSVMDWEFDRAVDGNIALTGEVEPGRSRSFTLALAFGQGLENAVATLLQALGTPYDALRRRSLQQWERACRRLPTFSAAKPDDARLYHASYSVLLGHEDKTFPGAFIASLSIPWGNSKGDDDRGGYHLVWTRDLVKTALGLLAARNTETPLRALIYLAAAQQADGGFPQNSWLNGEPYWTGVQLDEVSFPVLLAERLRQDRALGCWDPYPMIRLAMRFLIDQGPATGQERWEELAGYSPSTLAANIAALVVAAGFARERKEPESERFLLEYADFLEGHLDRWTVTDRGTLDPAVPRHFVRICPVDLDDPESSEDPNTATVRLPNLDPDASAVFPAREIIDGGFLELVRYGVRAPDDPIVLDSLTLVDRFLKVETPYGPVWHRYNHDGYGDRDNGDPFGPWGTGRAWPLLTGERGLYELAAGRDPAPYLRAMERLATTTGLLPEQVWDRRESPRLHLTFGRPTGAATPLLWAHSEYLKLLRSASDGEVFGRIPAVAERYLGGRRHRTEFEIWKPNRRVRSMRAGTTLRVLAGEPFRLHVSRDEWRTVEDVESTATPLALYYVDLPTGADDRGSMVFTLYWPQRDRWEGQDYRVAIGAGRERPTGPRSSTPP
ncbi:MAG TPA: glycoside hydrolase family 15 protein [Thermoplasmata archaeon]|nr:glycoside hydrolase family 15 protein [Thermoplasmata archaeon]